MGAGIVRLGRRGLVVALGVMLAAAPTSSYPTVGVQASEPPPNGGVVFTLTTRDSWEDPSSVVDSSGNTTVTWAEGGWRGPVRAVRRPAGGVWGRPVTIGRGTSPVVAADDRGNVTVLFETGRRGRTVGVSAVRRLVEGGWQKPVHLSKDLDAAGYDPRESREGIFGAHRIDLAVNPRGDAVVVWQWGSFDRDRPFRIQSVYRPVGGSWSAPARLTEPNWSEEPRVAIGRGGDATVIYTDNALAERGRIISRRRVVGEGWRPPVLALRGGTDASDIVVDQWGTATLTFSRTQHGRSTVMATRRPADGVAWPTPLRVSPAGVEIWSWSQVQHPSGAISVAMQRPSGRIDVVRRPRSGPWQAAVPVSPAAQRAGPPVVATTATEVLVVLWRNESLGLRGRIRYPVGGWTPAFQVSPGTGDVNDYEAAVYPNSDTFALWELGSSTIKARRMFR